MPVDDRVVRNLKKLIEAKAPDRDIESYLSIEGVSQEEAERALKLDRIASRGVTASNGKLAGTARAFGQGLTFGFGDEIEAGVKSALGQGSYRDNVEAIRAQQDQFSTDHPWVSGASNLAGGLIMPGGALKGVATAGQAVKRGMALGGAMGAASGAGVSENMREIPSNMIEGGIAGGIMGGALPGIMPVGRAVGNKIADLGFRSPARSATRADDIVNRALARDNTTHDDLVRGLQSAEAEGIPLGVMDLAGANTAGVARAATMVPSSAKERGISALTERAMGQPDRVANSIVQKSGVSQRSWRDVANDIMKKREADATPLYEQAYKAAPEINDRDVLEMLSPDGILGPELPEVWAAAQRIAQRNGKRLLPIFEDVKDAQGNVHRGLKLTGNNPDLQTLDYVKRGLDSVINRSGSSGLAGTERGQIIRNKNKLVEKLKELVPDYGKALQAWRGETEALEALEAGRKVLTEASDMTAEQIGKLPIAEKEMFRLGAISAIRERIFSGKDGASQWSRIFGSNEQRAKIRAVFPDDASFETFRKAMELEARGTNTARSILHGSRTTPSAQEINDLGIDPGAMFEFAATGFAPTQLPRIGASALLRSKLMDARGAVAESLGSNLFNFNPAAQRSYVEQLRRRQQQALIEARMRNQRNARYGATAGRVTGLLAED